MVFFTGMNKLYLLFATLFFSLSPAFAVTNISTCQTLSPNTSYKLTANVAMTTATCFEFTGVTGGTGWIDLDCDGYTIYPTGSYPNGYRPIYVHNNDGVISWHNCVIQTTSVPGYGTQIAVGPYIDSNVGNDPTHLAAGPSVWSWSNQYYGGLFQSVNSDYTYSVGDQYYNSAIVFLSSDNSYVQGVTIDNSALPLSSGEYYGLITFWQSEGGIVEYSDLYGYPGAQGTGNTDDGILFRNDTQSTILPTKAGFTVQHNTVTDVYDAGVEWTGRWVSGYVGNNTFTRPAIAGVGCYSNHQCSLSNILIEYNTVVSFNAFTRLVYFAADPSDATTFLNYIDFEHNTIDTTSSLSLFGLNTHPFATTTGNLIGDNQFGGYLELSRATGFYDNGGNYCTGSYASTIYCN